MADTNGTSNNGSSFRGGPEWTVPLWRSGEQIKTTNSFEITSPLTGKVLYRSSAASTEDATVAIAAAQKAFPGWSKTQPSFRRDLFLRAAEEFARRKDDLWHFCSTETGSTEP